MRIYDHNRRRRLLRGILTLLAVLVGLALCAGAIMIFAPRGAFRDGVFIGNRGPNGEEYSIFYYDVLIMRNAVACFEADMGRYPADLTELYRYAGSDVKLWNGPYITSEGSTTVPGTLIPVNPYVIDTELTHHWRYDPDTGTVKSAINLILPDGRQLGEL